MSVRWGRTAVEWARSVTTSLASTAVTVRRATSMTPSAKSAPVCIAVSGDDRQIGGLLVQSVFEAKTCPEEEKNLASLGTVCY